MEEKVNIQKLGSKANTPQKNIRELLERYQHFWPWFLTGLIICNLVSYTILRYKIPIYTSSATILFQTDQDHVLKGLSAFDDLGLTEPNKNLANEIALFKSPTILESLVRKLHLSRTYFLVGQNAGIKKSELYKNTPFKLVSAQQDSLLDYQRASFELKVIGLNQFELYVDGIKNKNIHSFNSKIYTKIGLISFDKNNNFTSNTVGNSFIVELTPVKESAQQINQQISLARADEESDLISISTSGPLIQKNNEIITTLINEHYFQSILNKNEISRQTSNFINERISFITEELSDVEKDAETFKNKNKIIDLNTQGVDFVAKQNDVEQKIIQYSVQLSLNIFLQEYLQKQKGFTDLLPSNLGFDDASITSLTSQYNKLLLDRKRLLKNSSLKNPAVQKIDDQLVSLRFSIDESLKTNSDRLKITLNSLNNAEKKYKNQIANVPSYEREFRDIERQQKIKETLYIFLLQKREENELKTAASIGNTKVINEASSSGLPIEPNKKKILHSLYLIRIVAAL